MRVSSARGAGALVGVTMALTLTWSTSAGASADPAAEGRRAAPPVAIPVVASTNVYGDIVERIGSNRVDVVSVISDPAQDPHSYEASTRTQLELSKAKVVVENGGGYDDFIDRMLRSSGNTSADVINVVDVSGKVAPAGGELNEHVWYDVPTMDRLADRIAAALARAEPADAGTFRENAKEFKAELASLQARTDRIRADHGGTPVAVTEPVPLYLTEACGLVNRTPAAFSEAVEEGEEVSPRTLRDTLALFTGRKVEALVYNEQTAGPQTEKVKQAAEDNRIPVVSVTETLPAGRHYIGWMAANVDALQGALSR
ncbi:metal ABC transporter solute-binding protein, Zn/Mn family [Streptomyces sp. NBC_00091]|uniref:metal ABC transporter solute-binding protein, Zn/Mn family n=1 Tax=Streptomyces sp. NBC_00091 TaxID=2975648 RepID=UPI00225AD018|nr:zinc ABC transporter substrate-binding protein [Streptomyces sp. NBC_00091]MCX5381482.1 zinc ABC transporter substrate-binding protein [Streptomyces sp. NBC_00091]